MLEMTGGGCSQWHCLLPLAHGTLCSRFCSLQHLHPSDQQLNPFSLHGFDRVCFISITMACPIRRKYKMILLKCFWELDCPKLKKKSYLFLDFAPWLLFFHGLFMQISQHIEVLPVQRKPTPDWLNLFSQCCIG